MLCRAGLSRIRPTIAEFRRRLVQMFQHTELLRHELCSLGILDRP